MEGNIQTVWEAGYSQEYELNDFRIPESTDDGQWYVLASIDSDDNVLEENESNNQASASIVVSPTEPILVLSDEDIEIDYLEGAESFEISNSGTGTLTWELSVSEGSDWIEIENTNKSGSGQVTVSFKYTDNSDCDIRRAVILIESNASNADVKEVLIHQNSDPGNVPDLAIDEFGVVFGGREVDIELFVNNYGGCHSEQTEVEFFLCTEIDCDDPLSWLGSNLIDALQNGQSFAIHTSIILNDIEDGRYFLAVKVDPDGNVDEIDKENNVLYYEFNLNSTGIDNISLEDAMNVYPNPTSDWVNISLDVSSSSTGLMSIYDQMGRMVDQISIEELVAWNHRIDTRMWDAGIYSIVLMTNNKVVNKKLVVR